MAQQQPDWPPKAAQMKKSLPKYGQEGKDHTIARRGDFAQMATIDIPSTSPFPYPTLTNIYNIYIVHILLQYFPSGFLLIRMV
jgi:hypothetical protein